MSRTDQARWERLKSLLAAAEQLPISDRDAFVASQCAHDVSLRTELESLLRHADSVDNAGFLNDAAVSPESLDAARETYDASHALSSSILQCPICREPVSVHALSAQPSDVSLPIRDSLSRGLEEIQPNAALSSKIIHCATCGSALRVTGDPMVPTDETLHLAGTSVGHFELKKCVGRGGFGTVWKAWDSELHREVAIKIPHANAITANAADAFLNEARATAQLRHPNIVSVHEVGRLGESVYIVSDFVSGVQLNNWVPRTCLTFRQIANLMETIARAVDYSHAAGIVHRDLKPGNVMIDASGQPHLMDFGLAKRDAADVTVTLNGRILGTPAYMSPEQARGTSQSTDRRTDLYSLGVMLFELLTGDLPFRGNISTIVHQVIHDAPPSPRKLNRTIPIDLETICLKCLEKSPSRRFPAARVLADELARFQRNEPIHARPVSRPAQFGRWCQRNPVVATLGALVVTLLVTGAVAGFVAAEKQASLATEAMSANVRLSQANQELIVANAHARQKSLDANSAVNDFFTDVSESQELLAGSPGTQELRQRLLNRALAYYTRFVDEDSSRENELLLADVTGKLGSIQEHLGDRESGERRHQESLRRYTDLLAASPTDVELKRLVAKCHSNLASVQNALSKFAEAEQNALQAVEMLSAIRDQSEPLRDTVSLALVYQVLTNTFHEQGNADESLKYAGRAHELFEQIVQSEPMSPQREDLAASLFNQANGLYSLGNLTSASDTFQRAIALFQSLTEEQPDNFRLRGLLARCHANLAVVEFSGGNVPAASDRFLQAVNAYDQLVKDNPRVTEYRDSLAKSCQNLGMLYQAQGMLDKAIEHQQRAVVATDDPEVVALSFNNLGAIHFAREEYDEAANWFQKMSESLELVVARSPQDIAAMNKLATAYNNTASVLKATAGAGDAEAIYEKSIRIRRLIAEQSPLPEFARGLAETINNLAQLHAKFERYRQAEPLFRESIEIWSSVCAQADVADHHASLGETLVNLSRCYAARQNTESAEQLLAEAEGRINRAIELDATHAGAQTVRQAAEEVRRTLHEQPVEAETTSRDAAAPPDQGGD